MAKRSNPDSPFSALKSLRDKLGDEERLKAEKRRQAEEAERKRRASAAEEADLWAQALAGVRPIEAKPVHPKRRPEGPAQTAADEDAEVVRELEGLVSGAVPLDFTASDEYIEGRAMDCSRLELGRLRDGVFAIQAHLDLHGKNRDEARLALAEFFVEAQRKGHRCVNVICGRGLHTPGGKPVLKELLARWLATGKLSYNVLAFASAKGHDGGVGAVYVLLRKNPKRGP